MVYSDIIMVKITLATVLFCMHDMSVMVLISLCTFHLSQTVIPRGVVIAVNHVIQREEFREVK